MAHDDRRDPTSWWTPPAVGRLRLDEAIRLREGMPRATHHAHHAHRRVHTGQQIPETATSYSDPRGGGLLTTRLNAGTTVPTIQLPGAPYYLNALTGHMLVDDCGMLDTTEFRPSCLGHVDIAPWEKEITPPGFWDTVGAIVEALGKALISAMLPAVGSKLLGVFSDAMGRVFDTLAAELSGSSSIFSGINISIDIPDIELPSIDLSGLMGHVDLTGVLNALHTAYTPIGNTIAAATNNIVMMLKDFDPSRAYLYAFVGLRHSLMHLRGVKLEEPAAVVALVQQAIGQCSRIRSLKDAVDCDRVRGNIVQIMEAAPIIEQYMNRMGELDTAAFDDLVNRRMPPFEQFVSMDDVNRVLSGGGLDGQAVAQGFVDKYAGDREKLLEDWKNVHDDVVRIVPESMRRSTDQALTAMTYAQETIAKAKADGLHEWNLVESDITAMWRDVYEHDPIVDDDTYRRLKTLERDATSPSYFSRSATVDLATYREQLFNVDRLSHWRDQFDVEYARRSAMRAEVDGAIGDAIASLNVSKLLGRAGHRPTSSAPGPFGTPASPPRPHRADGYPSHPHTPFWMFIDWLGGHRQSVNPFDDPGFMQDWAQRTTGPSPAGYSTPPGTAAHGLGAFASPHELAVARDPTFAARVALTPHAPWMAAGSSWAMPWAQNDPLFANGRTLQRASVGVPAPLLVTSVFFDDVGIEVIDVWYAGRDRLALAPPVSARAIGGGWSVVQLLHPVSVAAGGEVIVDFTAPHARENAGFTVVAVGHLT